MKLYKTKIINYRNYQVFGFFMHGISKRLWESWNWNLDKMVIKYWEILLEKHCKKLLSSVNSFWVEIGGKGVNINWLVKLRGHLNKAEKEQTKNKQKRLPALLPYQVIFTLK